MLKRTEEEVSEGKAIGPLTEGEVDDLFGKAWAPVRRVGLAQSAGVRPIDDFSEFGHNASLWTHERVDLEGVDAIVGIAKTWAEAVKRDGTVSVTLASGEVLTGVLHPGFQKDRHLQLLGRALDLKRAFKQVPISPTMARAAVICLWHPGRRTPAYYVLRAMLFVARNAVFVFGTVARVLRLVQVVLFLFAWAQYADDFPQLEPAATANGEVSAEDVLGLLGWTVKPVGPADSPAVPRFGSEFGALGVLFDLRQFEKGIFQIKDRPDRVRRVGALVEEIVANPRLRRALAVTLRGLLSYMRAQCFGRCGAIALHFLAAVSASDGLSLEPEVVEHLRFWPEFLGPARPRQLRLGDDQPPLLIWTDGAEEDSGVGVGAVRFDRSLKK
ncbi:MAG: hypothetical protein NXI07_14705, partial [bacterium]|nr:hypothetical protein [bacterium]